MRDALDDVRAALTSEDEIAHGQAVVERDGQMYALGACAYCDDEWPCRTQRGIERLLAALAAPSEPGAEELDVPEAAVIPEEPTSTLAWALRMVGAFTVRDDSDNICTMALGGINSVAERMDNWLSHHPEMYAALAAAVVLTFEDEPKP